MNPLLVKRDMVEELGLSSYIPYWSGSSFTYGDNADIHRAVVDHGEAIVLDAFENIPYEVKCGRTFTIAEYGASDGTVSLKLFSKLIKMIKRKYGEEQEVQISYEDLPVNNFMSLFLQLHGSQSYLQQYTGVFAIASGISFHKQCFPSYSIHLGFSSCAVHWLSKRPCGLKSIIHYTTSGDEFERRAYAEIAARDWERFLICRSKELVPGGRLVVIMPAKDDSGQIFSSTHRVKHASFKRLSLHWRSLLDDGLLTDEEYQNTSLNLYYRTTKEVQEPFDTVTSEVYRSGLRLVSAVTRVLPDFLHVKVFTSNEQNDNKEEEQYAEKFINIIRIWANSSFKAHLRSDRSEEDKSRIVDELFRRYKLDVLDSPRDHAHDAVVMYVHIRKEL